MTKQFTIKLLKHMAESAKADGNICKTYNNSAKAEVKAFTPEMESYHDHLMEWSVWRKNY